MTAVEFAATVRPPWSWAIAETEALTALGVVGKTVENRGRPIPAKHVGKPIAIHAGQTWCPIGERDPRVRGVWWTFAQAIQVDQVSPLLAAIGDHRTGFTGWLKPDGLWMPTGAVVAVALLADCHQAEQRANGYTCCAPWGDREYHGSSRPGPAYHLVLSDIQRLPKPVSARGQQLVPWRMPEKVAAAVNAQVIPAVAW